jgi:Translin family
MRGELMRRAINNISLRKGQSVAFEICTTLRQLQSSFQRIYVPNPRNTKGFPGDLQYKIEVMKASVSKVENACYNVHVRGSERPDGWSLDFKDDGGERVKRSEREGGDEDDFGGGKRQRSNQD